MHDDHRDDRLDDPGELRDRAATLAALAARLEASAPGATLDHGQRIRLLGSRAHLCRAGLARREAHVHRTADELRELAHRLLTRAGAAVEAMGDDRE